MSGIPIYILPEKTLPDSDEYIPISSETITSKISPPNLRKYIDKTISLDVDNAIYSDDYIKIDGFTNGTRTLIAKTSLLYSVSTGVSASLNEIVMGSDPRLTNLRNPNPHTHYVSDIINFSPDDYVLTSAVGSAHGIAPLGSDSKVSSIYLPTPQILHIPSASGITSFPANLIPDTNVQGAIEKLSNAAYIYVNAIAAGVIGVNNVQSAFAQKLSLFGGTMTGLLVAQTNNFRVGVNDLVAISNRVGIGTALPTFKLDVNGDIRGREMITVSSDGFPQIVFQNANTTLNRYGMWRDPSDMLAIGPQTINGNGNAALCIYRDTSARFNSHLSIGGDFIIAGGNLVIERADTGFEGGQIQLNKSLNNNSGWFIDVYGDTEYPTFRIFNHTDTSNFNMISGSGAWINDINDSGLTLNSGHTDGLGMVTGTIGNQISYVNFRNNGSLLGDISVNEATSGNPLELNSSVSNNVVLAVGGGNVGIGTNAPAVKLDITGNLRLSNSSPIIQFNETDTGKQWYLAADGSTFSLRKDAIDGAYPILVDGSGRVGISNTGPQSTLDVGGAIISRGDGSGYSAFFPQVGTDPYTNASRLEIRNVGTESYINTYWHGTGAVRNLTVGGSNAFSYYNGTTGNVGIGTTTPVSKLDVAGAAVVETNLYVKHIDGKVYNNNSITPESLFLQYNSPNNSVNFCNNKMVFDGSNSTLTLAGEMVMPSSLARINFGANNVIRATALDGCSSTVANSQILSWYGFGFGPSITGQPVPYGENAIYINCRTGDLSARGDIVAFASSDKNLKDNIKNIENPIEKIKRINGVTFDWNDKQTVYTGHDIGVIAQEIEEVLPEIVTTRDNGYKAVKYEKIVALLIECIKELHVDIEKLKSERKV